MSAYTRELRDVIFHASHAQRALERAQAKAPESHKRALDAGHRALAKMINWSRRAARVVEIRGGIRGD